MRLFIPTIGTKLKLTQDWHFKLYAESRNDTLITGLGMENYYMRTKHNWWIEYANHNQSHMVILPTDTELQVDRIYIRKNANDFDSISFYVNDCPDVRLKPKKLGGQMKGKARFWVKLYDANQIECEVVK